MSFSIKLQEINLYVCEEYKTEREIQIERSAEPYQVTRVVVQVWVYRVLTEIPVLSRLGVHAYCHGATSTRRISITLVFCIEQNLLIISELQSKIPD